jgi:hypothetical protein
MFLIYREAVSGGDESAELEVSAARGITAEEVIAHHREFEAAQDDRI